MRPRSRQALVALLIAGMATTACVVLIFVIAGRDDAGVRAPAGPGERPRAGDPAVTGIHARAAIRADGRPLSRDQVLTALALGDVVVFYGGARPPDALRALQQDVSGLFDPDLAAAGQAIVLAARPGTRGVIAARWGRVLHADGPEDPRLRQFAEAWLGRGNVQ